MHHENACDKLDPRKKRSYRSYMFLTSFVPPKKENYEMARNAKLDYLTGTARRLFTPF
jgi:hypothetical protein